MTGPTDVVGVLRVHLEEAAQALEWAYGHFAALDLAEGYRQGKPSLRHSRATAMMEKSKTTVDAYLAPREEESNGQ